MSDFTHKIIESLVVTVFFGLIYLFYYKFISYSWKDSLKNSLLISFIFFIVSLSLNYIGLYNFIRNIL
ncbi:Uncharacterised protein [Candidatus Bartonella washoeensis]|uniref:Uncharacterized protein n=1 Tax=Candidatus Bartonella washoeensis Sb944nv TaxID=1094563 RepID=J0Q3W3_9HYPH|nr:hypothetical protein MCQ_00644 [Bartonella washoeensis Sb944nv]SPU26836.1 Uncharacterised protein [Bartonella washoeensis]